MKRLSILGGRKREPLFMRGIATASMGEANGFAKNRADETSGVSGMGAAVAFTKSEICGRGCATWSIKRLSSGRRKREPLIV
jgi:hypothetical protein